MFGRQRWLVLVVLAAMLLAACGSGGGDTSAEPSGDTSSDAPASQDAPSSDDPEPSSGGGDYPEVADGLFEKGTIRLEVRGDRSEDIELNGTALITAGNVFMSGADDANTASAQIIWSGAEGAGGVSWGLGNMLGGADLNLCSFEVSKNDPTGLAGTIECENTDGLENGATGLSIDLKIEFSVSN